MIKNKFVFIFIPVLVLVTFFGLWNVFFQQDEWYWLGQVLIAQKIGVLSLVKVDGFHFNPFYPLSFYVFFSWFHLNWHPYAFYSITIHALNTFLIFFLTKRIFKNINIAYLTAVFFTLANVSQQAITWYGASLNVLPAATLGLISLHFFYSYYSSKKIKNFILSYVFLILGLGFKEDIMFLFLVYPLCLFLFKKQKGYGLIISTTSIAFVYVLIRGLIQKFGAENPLTHISGVDYITAIIRNCIVIPLMSFSQLFFSPLMVYNLGRYLTKGHEAFFARFSPYHNVEILIETTFFTIFTISLTILLLVFLILLIKKSKDKKVKNVLLLLTGFTLFSFSPFFLLPKGFGMESRHYYFPTVGASALLGYVVFILWKRIKQVNIKYLFLGCLLLYFGYNYVLDREQLQMVIDLSKPRIAFVQQIQQLYHDIPNGAVFLSSAEYMPFQSGMGQMLMVLFDDRYKFNNLLSGYILWNMGSQGYVSRNDASFGYFSDKELLKRVVAQNKVSIDKIYTFSWDNKTMKMIDMSQSIRKELSDNE